jgi:hypothetical protein
MKQSAAKAGRGKVAVLCGLGMVLAALVFRLVKPNLDSAPAAPPPSVGAPPVAGQAPTVAASASPAKPNVIRWPDATARNPFQSASVYPPQVVRVEPSKVTPVAAPPPTVDLASVARGAIHLKGTVQGERAIAMVNGRLYRAGESIAGFRIVEIAKRSITVEQAGTRVVVEAE